MLPKRTYSYIKTDPETPKTQLVIVTGFLVIAAIFQVEWPAYVALAIGALSVIVKPAGDGIVWVWFKFAELWGGVVNRVLLGLIYYLFITPIALLFRLFGNDPLQLDKSKGSVFEWREHQYKKEDLENPW
ncbi:MAG: hypothetical protein AAFW89_04315 [Bacteroidota bacterium]